MKIPNELQKALSAAKAVLENRRKIEAEIEKAISMQPIAEGWLQDAMEALGTAEADAVLSGQPANGGSSHRDALVAARDGADALQARIHGLRRRLVAQEDEILAAHESLGRLRNEFCEKAIEEFRATYLREAERFLEVVRSGRGLSDGLGVCFIGLSKTVIHDPLSQFPIPLSEERDLSLNRTYRGAHDGVVGVKDEFLSLERLADGIVKARQERDAKLKTIPSQPVQNVLGDYTGLTDAEWRAAQESAPRPIDRGIAQSYGGRAG